MRRGWKILIGVVLGVTVLLGLNAVVTTKLIQGAGHSPNVEVPRQTAALVLGFDRPPKKAAKRPADASNQRRGRHEMQDRVQNQSGVRGHS